MIFIKNYYLFLMEIVANNLLESLIFRSNIFNYDNKFLTELREKNLKVDLNLYSRG
jgi:hypothetical protein